MDEICYIYVDGEEVSEEERYVNLQCQECYEINKKGFLWPCCFLGDKKILCGCGKTINKGKHEKEQD